MGDAERWTVVVAGAVGLVALVAGAFVGEPPPVDADDDEVRAALVRRRGRLLVGSLLSVTAAALLLLPVAAVTVLVERSDGGWAVVAVASLGTWVLGFGMLAAAAVMVAAAAWREPDPGPLTGRRTLLDLAHLTTWSLSAPVAAVAVVATTAVGVQAELLGPLVVAGAALKVLTVVVEVAGTGRRRGWNAGGRAAGTSGVATVAWFAAVLAAIAVA